MPWYPLSMPGPSGSRVCQLLAPAASQRKYGKTRWEGRAEPQPEQARDGTATAALRPRFEPPLLMHPGALAPRPLAAPTDADRSLTRNPCRAAAARVPAPEAWHACAAAEGDAGAPSLRASQDERSGVSALGQL